MTAFRRPARNASGAGRVFAFVLSAVACAAFACVVFFSLLALWGIAAAPFVHLSSAAFPIVCALAAASAITVVAYKAVYVRLTGSRRRHRRVGVGVGADAKR